MDRFWSFAILPFIVSAFFIHYYINVFESYMTYIVIMCVTGLAFLWTARKRFVASVFTLRLFWYTAVAVIGLSILRTPFNLNSWVDIVPYTMCAVMLGSVGSDRRAFDKAFYVIIGFALYFAVSLWIQILIPSVFDAVMLLFTEKNRLFVYKLAAEGSGYTGFTINPGCTAAHVIAGMLVLFPRLIEWKGTLTKRLLLVLAMLFLFVTLLLTGKRGPVLFLLIVLTVQYLLLLPKEKRKTMALIGGIGIVAVLLLCVLFQAPLRKIPAIDRLFETAIGLFTGQNISNNRTPLYSLAWTLFCRHPIFGVGWSMFRTHTPGNVTLYNELDVHNIYLQLLCENGIFGTLIILSAFAVFVFVTFKAVRRCAVSADTDNKKWLSPLLFSLGYQLYVLIYGLTENPIYDHNYVILYFLGLAITVAYLQFEANMSPLTNRRFEDKVENTLSRVQAKLKQTFTKNK